MNQPGRFENRTRRNRSDTWKAIHQASRAREQMRNVNLDNTVNAIIEKLRQNTLPDMFKSLRAALMTIDDANLIEFYDSVGVELKQAFSIPQPWPTFDPLTRKLESLANAICNGEEHETVEVTIGTHDGQFHADEVFSIALIRLTLKLLFGDKVKLIVVRSRNSEVWETCDILIDVGSRFNADAGIYDHHHDTFTEKSELTGTGYSSYGLISDRYLNLHNLGSNYIKLLYYAVGKELDEDDTGKIIHSIRYIVNYLNPHNLNLPQEKFRDPEYMFSLAISITEKFLMPSLRANEQVASGFDPVLKRAMNDLRNEELIANGFFLIDFEQQVSNTDYLITLDPELAAKVNFVIVKRNDGTYSALGVRSSSDPNNLNVKIQFPVMWAGKDKELAEISGIPGLLFCHKNRYMIKASSIDVLIQACNSTIKINQTVDK